MQIYHKKMRAFQSEHDDEVWVRATVRESNCFYYIIEQTYNAGLHSRRHPMEFDAGTRPFASFNAPSS